LLLAKHLDDNELNSSSLMDKFELIDLLSFEN
jgi:hypothetical protein